MIVMVVFMIVVVVLSSIVGKVVKVGLANKRRHLNLKHHTFKWKSIVVQRIFTDHPKPKLSSIVCLHV